MTINRRVILRHTAGPLAGLREIVGVWSVDLPVSSQFDGVALQPDGRVARLVLGRVEPSWVEYVEDAGEVAA